MDRYILLGVSLLIDAVIIAFPLVMLVRVISFEIGHRRRMRELDELAKRQDFWGLMRWGEKYRKGNGECD